MQEQKRLSIQISGNKYPITTVEEPAYVEALGREMDQMVRQIMGGTPASVTEALVLLCLHYLDASKKAESTADNLRSQIAEYLEEASKARTEAIAARRELGILEAMVGEQNGGKKGAAK